MKRQILLLAITAAALSSCTTAYKTGQTPDDVYFSPTRPQDEYVRVEEKQDDRYQYDEKYYDDRYLRMKVHNPSQWSTLDDWYSYDRLGYSYNSYYGSYYNPYTSWNYYYNPYCHNNVIAYHPGYIGQTSVAQNVPKPRNFNLASYTNINNYNNANNSVKMNSYKTGMVRPVYNNRNSNNSFSNTLKQIFNTGTNVNSSSNSSYSSPSRSYSPSSGSSSGGGGSSGSSGSSSGGGGGATRPSRGGN